jgi:hypothetical protein
MSYGTMMGSAAAAPKADPVDGPGIKILCFSLQIMGYVAILRNAVGPATGFFALDSNPWMLLPSIVLGILAALSPLKQVSANLSSIKLKALGQMLCGTEGEVSLPQRILSVPLGLVTGVMFSMMTYISIKDFAAVMRKDVMQWKKDEYPEYNDAFYYISMVSAILAFFPQALLYMNKCCLLYTSPSPRDH